MKCLEEVTGKIPIFTLFLHGKAVKNDQSFACNNKLVINKKKTRITVISSFPQQGFLRYRIADDFVYVVMKRHLCVESRLSALSAAILTSNGLIDRFSLWLPGCMYSCKMPQMLCLTR